MCRASDALVPDRNPRRREWRTDPHRPGLEMLPRESYRPTPHAGRSRARVGRVGFRRRPGHGREVQRSRRVARRRVPPAPESAVRRAPPGWCQRWSSTDSRGHSCTIPVIYDWLFFVKRNTQHSTRGCSPKGQMRVRVRITRNDRVSEGYSAHAAEEQLAYVVELRVAAVDGSEHRGDDMLDGSTQTVFGPGEFATQFFVGTCS